MMKSKEKAIKYLSLIQAENHKVSGWPIRIEIHTIIMVPMQIRDALQKATRRVYLERIKLSTVLMVFKTCVLIMSPWCGGQENEI